MKGSNPGAGRLASLDAVLSSVGYIPVCWLFLYFLYRKNTFLKV